MTELGPLPEPAAMTTKYEAVAPGEGSPMYPAGTLRPCGRMAVGYTADQMRAYALQERAAERERCAKLCDVIAADDDDGHYDGITAEECAYRIRAG